MRRSGVCADRGGVVREISGRGRDYVTLGSSQGNTRVDLADLDDLLKVTTTATWRGEQVYVSWLSDGEIGFHTYSRELAEAERLAGDQYGGWTGVAPMDELSDVQEKVVSIHPGRGVSEE